jgi:hypothetical protein
VERPDKSATEFRPILNKNDRKGTELLKKIVSLQVFFLSPNSFKKLILLCDRNIFLSGRIFLLNWPKSYKELAALVRMASLRCGTISGGTFCKYTVGLLFGSWKEGGFWAWEMKGSRKLRDG